MIRKKWTEPISQIEFRAVFFSQVKTMGSAVNNLIVQRQGSNFSLEERQKLYRAGFRPSDSEIWNKAAHARVHALNKVYWQFWQRLKFKIASAFRRPPKRIADPLPVPSFPIEEIRDTVRGVSYFKDTLTHSYHLSRVDAIAQVAGANSAIPGGAGNFTGFQSPSPPQVAPQPAISGGNVAFVGAGTSGQQGVYVASAVPSPPQIKIADLNTAIPGGTGNFTSFFTQVGIGGGNVVFIGNGSGGQTGIYAVPAPPEITPTPPEIKIADLNTAIPSGTGNFTGFAQAAPVTSGGNVAFIGSGSGGQQGIYLSGTTPSPPEIKIADLNTAIPGGTGNFTGFVGSPAISGNNVAFIGNGSGGQQGIYLSNGTPAPPEIKVADTNTVMPGTSANFQFFTSVSMDTSAASTDLAFVGGGTVSGQTFKGVYFATPTPPDVTPSPPDIKVADFSTAIPNGIGTFSDFGNVAFDPDSSGDHIIAFLGMGANGQEGIYADVNDVLTKVVDLSDMLDGQTPLSLNLGTNGLDSGELTFAATFAGGSQELFTAAVPEPSTFALAALALASLVGIAKRDARWKSIQNS